MKSLVLTTLFASALAVTAVVPAHAGTVGNAYGKWTLYSDKTISCIETDAMKLTAGQQTYLDALLDEKLANEAAARKGLPLGEVIKVHGFIWTAGPGCMLKS